MEALSFKEKKHMPEFAILLDSTCNMVPENLKEFDIDYCLMSVSVGDKVYSADLSWPDMSPKEFYDIMRGGTRVYTQLVTEEEYTNKFTKYLKEGKDILYIACSSGLSGSVKVAYKVAEKLKEEYPDQKILILDSLISGMGQGMMGIRASLLRKEGKDIEEIYHALEADRLKYNQFATVGSLTYLKNAGRVTAGAAFFGNIIGIKPIIISDVKGHNYAYKKVRGRKAALAEIADSIVSNCVDPEHHYLCIDNADCMEDAKAIVKMVEDKGVHFERYFLNPLGPILGASCGPDVVIAFFYGKEVTIEGE